MRVGGVGDARCMTTDLRKLVGRQVHIVAGIVDERGRLDDAVPDMEEVYANGGVLVRRFVKQWHVTINGETHEVGTDPDVELLD